MGIRKRSVMLLLRVFINIVFIDIVFMVRNYTITNLLFIDTNLSEKLCPVSGGMIFRVIDAPNRIMCK